MSMDLYGKPVRIRLFFEEPGMLSKSQVDQGLAKSWYLVSADVLSIGQLAARIDHDYRLGGSCPQGLVLEMRGFVLPSGQSARILQDSDLVRVRRKYERVSRVHSGELLTNSLSVDNEEIDHAYRVGRGGLLAIEEFEKEAGGYQGELSEDEDAEFSLSSGKKMQSALDERKRLMAKESSGKKRKRSFHVNPHTQNDLLVPPPKPRMVPEGIDSEPSKLKKQKTSGKKKHDKVARGDRGSSQIMALEFNTLEGLPRSEDIDGGVFAKIEKKKKKKNRDLVEPTGSDVHSADTSSPKEANAQETTPNKLRKVKYAKETADSEKPAGIESGSQKLKLESSRKGEKSKKRRDTNHDNHEMELLKGKSSEVEGHNTILLNNENASEQANTAEKRPSRSARRKKARRRWLREQGQNGIVPKKDDVKGQQTKQAEPMDRTDTSGSETSEDEAEAVAEAEAEAKAEVEVEVEAEEEILPRMCAPGHIRFEPVEDARDEGLGTAPVLLSYTEVRCKKQGQAWGQEKSRGRYSEDGHNRSGKMESRSSEGRMEQSPSPGVVANKIDFEKLPLLSRIPWVGDLLAYQLVELTASWTPELSSYRVGKVSMYDGVNKMITLLPLPECTIHVQEPEEEDGEPNEEVFLPPYNPDGTLEVSLATLMEVRVLEEGFGGGSITVQVNPHSQESPDVHATTVDDPIKSSQPATPSCNVPQEPEEPIAASTADNTQGDHAEFRASGSNEGGEVGPSSTTEPEPVLDQRTDAGWQDMLSQEINNKKLELSLKAGKDVERQSCDDVPSQAPTDGVQKVSNQVTPAENGKRNPRVNGAPIIRHRYMRTGALGPTMALLRASQIL